MTDHVIRRGGRLHYRRRVPQNVAHLDPRGHVAMSLRTVDPTIAARRAKIIDHELETYWDALLGVGDVTEAKRRYDAAVKLARSFGFGYRPMAELVAESDAPAIREIGQRLEAIAAAGDAGGAVADALLGAVDKPALTMSAALDEFWPLTADRVLGKSEEQIRRWKAPRAKAIGQFIALAGDKAMPDVTRDDALDYRQHLLDRARKGDLDPGSANKDIGHLAQVFQVVSDGLRLGLENPFTKIKLAGATANRRESFSPGRVRALLADPALPQTSLELRCLLWAMADTGARILELVGLASGDIVFEAEIPHILIRPNDVRMLKTRHSRRAIPLVGSALAAFRQIPGGFAHYRGRNTDASAALNKFLRTNKLTAFNETIYGLRHAFQDRLTAVEAPERIQADLMGHKLHRPRYGAGPSLAQLHEWIVKVATDVDPAALTRT